MIAYKFNIQNDIDISNYIREYNNVIRFAYNRFQENKKYTLSDVERLVKSTMNNLNYIDASIIKIAVNKAKSLKKDNIIFGGKNLFFRRMKNLVSKEEYKALRQFPLMLRGSKSDTDGNRKAKLNIIEDNIIILKLNKNLHIPIQLPKLRKKQRDELSLLQSLCENKETSFTIEVDNKSISIIFDENILSMKEDRKFIENRILSFDMNPNYIGLSIIDWKDEDNKSIIYKEIIDMTELNKMKDGEKATNKRSYETAIISKHIINLAKHYQVDCIGFESLNIKSKQHNKGRRYNRLVNNQWNRNQFITNIKKRSNIAKIKFYEVYPHYSSFIGQLTNEDDYDMVGASIELSRRTFKFKNNLENVMYPKFNVDSLSSRWKDLIKNQSKHINSWVDLFNLNKSQPESSYRLLFNKSKFIGSSFSMKSCKSKILLHS